MTFVCACGITTYNSSERIKHFRSKQHKTYLSLLEKGICYQCKERSVFYFSGKCINCDENVSVYKNNLYID